MATAVLTARQAPMRLIWRNLRLASLVDSDAVAMFALFGLSWAIPAAALWVSTAFSGLLRAGVGHLAR